LFEFREDTHQYFLDGVEFPSVTQICRFISREKNDKAPPHLLEAAADRGRRVHEYCMLYDYDALEEVDSDCVGYVKAYQAFLRDYRVVAWWFVEKPSANADLGFAGTIDRYGWIDGEFCLVDIKTSSVVDVDSLSAQLCGYALLINNESYSRPPRVDRCWGVQLKKDGTYKVVEIDLNKGKELFESCLKLHKLLEQN
jgi:hypothetical protein